MKLSSTHKLWEEVRPRETERGRKTERAQKKSVQKCRGEEGVRGKERIKLMVNFVALTYTEGGRPPTESSPCHSLSSPPPLTSFPCQHVHSLRSHASAPHSPPLSSPLLSFPHLPLSSSLPFFPLLFSFIPSFTSITLLLFSALSLEVMSCWLYPSSVFMGAAWRKSTRHGVRKGRRGRKTACGESERESAQAKAKGKMEGSNGQTKREKTEIDI